MKLDRNLFMTIYGVVVILLSVALLFAPMLADHPNADAFPYCVALSLIGLMSGLMLLRAASIVEDAGNSPDYIDED
jgi:hypothetical protein